MHRTLSAGVAINFHIHEEPLSGLPRQSRVQVADMESIPQ
jgi:hypothetical protein